MSGRSQIPNYYPQFLGTVAGGSYLVHPIAALSLN